jgi:hypothetical protein
MTLFFQQTSFDENSHIPAILRMLDDYKAAIQRSLTQDLEQNTSPANQDRYNSKQEQYLLFLRLDELVRALIKHKKGRVLVEDTFREGEAFNNYVKNLPRRLASHFNEIRAFASYESGAIGVSAAGLLITLTPGLECLLLGLLIAPVDPAAAIIGAVFIVIGLALLISGLSQASPISLKIDTSLRKTTKLLEASYAFETKTYVFTNLSRLDLLNNALDETPPSTGLESTTIHV